jgi:alkaline phosphatase D
VTDGATQPVNRHPAVVPSHGFVEVASMHASFRCAEVQVHASEPAAKMIAVQRVSRRGFLLGTMATVLAACRSSAGSGASPSPSGPSTSGTTTVPPTSAPPTTVAPTTTLPLAPTLPGDPFTLGVASGDALSDAVVLWTRLAPDPLADNDRAGMPAEDVPVVWEVATGQDFADTVASGVATASPDHAHTVHVDVTGLRPATTYWYRFRVGSYTSTTGRTVTMPAAEATAGQLVIGHACCQNYEEGRYAAHRDIAAAELDALIWLGDYIYEGRAHPVGQDGTVRSHNGAEPTDLRGYRGRYALYRSDPDLQAAHASTGWYVIWDDHEVENNYAGDHGDDPVSDADFPARRAAAYQAWWEHQPVRLPAPTSGDYQIYRSFPLGPLGQLFLLDGRQYRSDQACGDRVLSLDPPCTETFAPGRTMLGDVQQRWLLDGMAANTGPWNVIGNQTILADLTLNGAVLNFDQWDGYPEARQLLLGGIEQAGLTNVVTITGDIHAAGVTDLTLDDENGRRVVATELITSSVSSSSNLPLGAEAVLAQFPDVHYADGTRRGWVRNTITATSWEAEYRAVDDATRADSTISVPARFRIQPSAPGAQRIA